MAGKVKKFFKWTGIAVGTGLVLFGAFAAHEWNADKPFFVNNFYNRVFVQFAIDSPETLTSIGVLENIGINGHNAEWSSATLEWDQKQFQWLIDVQTGLDLYNDEDLDPDELFSKRILAQFIQEQIAQKDFQFHNYPINQLFGMQNNLPRFLDSQHRVTSVEDAEHYVTRVSKIDTVFEESMEGLLVREEMSIIPPTFIINKVLDEMTAFIATAPEENILYTSLQGKLEGAEDISEEEQARLLEEVSAAIQNDVYPAYQSYVDYFTKLRDKSNNDAGVWKFPRGDEYYNLKLKEMTTTDMTADEIHNIGLAEVDRIQGEIVTILDGEGFDISKGFTTLIKEMAEDERFYYPDTDEGREQILADYRAIIEEIDAGIDKVFNTRPEAGVEVKRVPEFAEKTAPGAYYQGPDMGGNRPGVFFANLYDIKATPKYGMRTLAYHEAVPGHHFQIAIQNELEGLPIFRSFPLFTAYIEGWALYTERLAWELGFQDDPYDNIGRLQAELFRAVRLVVDTGIHAQRWTREEAITYMLDNTGITETDVVSEIERYIVMPGQATAYKVGMMEILRLREEAREALGDKFNISEFHDVVLKTGAIPLSLLRELVMDYIADKQAA